MPIYEYRCRNCGKINEFLIGVSEEKQDLRCRFCGGEALERVLSAPTIGRGGERRMPGRTCCGREERCETPPCSSGTCELK
ncbi:MAG: zinc ribbon domain-containing protein [Acidobacteria bacterium]|nr:zinc ribbon domain-containing protein [Acidobacteriota bacterium]